MNRAMFSGVAGLKAHQTKMDVIGNNIANVNTFGYKSQRAVFSDVYYQTIKSASGGTTNRGGINPSSVGYGSSLTAIQAQMTQSSLQSTGFGMDVAITGEGFLQVMDADGNTFYTKAGLLDYDSNGYLTDINGNFVLGSASADGKPASQKIKLDNIGSVSSQKPETKVDINGITYTMTASNSDKAGNVSMSFGSAKDLPAGLKADATISTSGAISVRLNAYETFNSMSELNAAINAAITEANGGKVHAGGEFTLSASKNMFGTESAAGSFTGKAENVGAKLEPGAGNLFGGALTIDSFDLSTIPGADGASNLTLTKIPDGTGFKYKMSMIVGSDTYEAEFPANIAKDATVVMKDATGKSITAKVADKDKLTSQLNLLPAGGGSVDAPVNVKAPKFFFGGMEVTSVSPSFSGSGKMDFSYALLGNGNYEITCKAGGKEYKGEISATDGGTVQLKVPGGDDSLTGFINVKVPSKADMMKNYGIPATGAAGGFTGGSTNANFLGGAKITGVGTAFSGAGAPAFSCTYDDTTGAYAITATVGGKTYTGSYTGTAAGSLVMNLTPPVANDTITMSIPSQADMLTATGAADAAALQAALQATTGNHNYNVTPASNSDALLLAKLTDSLSNHNYVGLAATAGVNTPLTGAQIIEGNFGKVSGVIDGFDDNAFGGLMKLLKTSSNFTGSGTVSDADFKATYRDTTPPAWEITMNISGVEYKTSVNKDTVASSLLMTSPNGDSIQVSKPDFDELTNYYKTANPGTDPTDGASVSALTGGKTLTVTPATQSKDLGFGTTSFGLTGGTAGGAITLDQLSAIAIGSDGTVTVGHPDKGTVIAGRISLATFANPSGLQLEGNNYYSSSANSGDAKLADPGTSGSGGLKSNALEMSNVDLSAEFADMITTQRGFQANSRIITVSDTMLEELINLKR